MIMYLGLFFYKGGMFKMPINLKTSSLKYKDPSTGEYKSVDVVGEAITFDAEAYAKGTRNEIEITDTSDKAYHRNAKYYAEQAQEAAQLVEAAANAVRFDKTQSLSDAQKTQARNNIDAASAQKIAEL